MFSSKLDHEKRYFLVRSSTNWDVVCREINSMFDRIEAAVTKPDESARRLALEDVDDALFRRHAMASIAFFRWARTIRSRVARGKLLFDCAALTFLPYPFNIRATMNRTDVCRDSIAAFVALKRFHLKYGMYPETLEDAVEFLPHVPIDPWNELPMIYRRSDSDSFVLYSVDVDRQDDGGPEAFSTYWRKQDHTCIPTATNTNEYVKQK